MTNKELQRCPWRVTNHRCDSSFLLCHCPWLHDDPKMGLVEGKYYVLLAKEFIPAGTEVTYDFRLVEKYVDTSFVDKMDCADSRRMTSQCPSCPLF